MMDIVKILGVGLSGFGFLLMYLAYRLILKMMPDPKTNMIKVINRYMLICLVMTLSVGIFTYFDAVYKNNLIEEQNQTIAKTDNDLKIVTTSQTNSFIADTLLHYTNTGDTNKVNKAKDDQKKTLDNLSTYFNEDKDSAKFKGYKDSILKFTDLLLKKGLPKNLKDSFQAKYQNFNKAISGMTLQKINAYKIEKE